MLRRSALVISIDGFGAALLGPYGNAWASTPQLDHFAAQALVVEHALTDDWLPDTVFRSFWQGRHAWCPQRDQPTLAQLCRDHGITPILVSDDPVILDHALAGDFEKRLVSYPHSSVPAKNIEQTEFARFVDQALAVISRLPQPHLLWIHAQGMMSAWDAPMELREVLCDESDPPPVSLITPPVWEAPPLDPDLRWGFRVAGAAQVGVLDHFVGILLDEYTAAISVDLSLAVFTSPRGYPLGEHQLVGNVRELNYSEQLHVPLIIRGLQESLEPQRTQAICQPATVFGTLADWLSLPGDRGCTGAFALSRSSSPEDSRWQRAAVGSRVLQALRTTEWCLRVNGEIDTICNEPASARRDFGAHGPNEVHCELFAKPDDRWEVNEVSRRVHEVVVLLQQELDQFRRHAIAEELDRLPTLAKELVNEIN